MQQASPLREFTCHMGSHSVTCHPAEVTFPLLPQPKLVLDLATLEGCNAELTYALQWGLVPIIRLESLAEMIQPIAIRQDYRAFVGFGPEAEVGISETGVTLAIEQ